MIVKLIETEEQTSRSQSTCIQYNQGFIFHSDN